jgi:hypothetical protein
VTSSSGDNGNISPVISDWVDRGDSQQFTATPDADYVVSQWFVNGSVVQNGGAAYKLNNITGPRTVEVTFGSTVPADTRIIRLTGDLAFGDVAVGSSAQRTLTTHNDGNSVLSVFSVSYPSGFSGDWNGSVSAGGSQDVTVTFTPTTETSYSGTLTVNANETSGMGTRFVSGSGIAGGSMPDLIITNVSYMSGTYRAGDEFGVAATEANRGDAEVIDPFVIQAVFSPTTNWNDPESLLVYEFTETEGLDSGESFTTNVTQTIGDTLPVRSYYLGIMIDVNNDIDEGTGETNNIWWSEFADITVQAQDFTYTNTYGNITITGYIGAGGAVTIPDTIEGLPVTSLGNGVFSGCSNLTSVIISGSITNIGNSAFYECTSLISVTLPDSITSIGEGAFAYCSSLTSITIPYSVTGIGKSVFAYCTSLSSVTIFDSVTSIGDEAFLLCHILPSVAIPDSVTSIGNYAFCLCTNLTSLTIPSGVTNIGNAAFSQMLSLTSVYFKGAAPSLGGEELFTWTENVTVYHLFESTGWPPVPDTWAGCPTALWRPDSDSDGIPDSWEQQYFGGTTNANPAATCSNGINTVRQAYIAGLNPNDPQSTFLASFLSDEAFGWNAVSGRVYAVYWATNLMNGFQCLESNIPWMRASFTNQTAVPCGYYKIDVQLEE